MTPSFAAFILGLFSALFLDHLRIKRERRIALIEYRDKIAAENNVRQEKELTQLNLVTTAMGFNIEALQHLVMQQVLPHYTQSCQALTELNTATTDQQFQSFCENMNKKFSAMVTRSPEPYFFEVEFFREIPFILENDPEILKLSGWMTSFMRELKNNLRSRNDYIDRGHLYNDNGGMTLSDFREHVRIQVVIGGAEVVHSLQLFEQLLTISKKLRKAIEEYKSVGKTHLKITPSESLEAILADLRRIAQKLVPDLPPPEPHTA